MITIQITESPADEVHRLLQSNIWKISIRTTFNPGIARRTYLADPLSLEEKDLLRRYCEKYHRDDLFAASKTNDAAALLMRYVPLSSLVETQLLKLIRYGTSEVPLGSSPSSHTFASVLST
jgi:hypothetical protein